jgi:hypothetical protein
MLPDDRDFGPAMARLTQRQRIFVDVCSAASSRLRRRVEPATAIAGTLRTGPHDRGNLLAKTKITPTRRLRARTCSLLRDRGSQTLRWREVDSNHRYRIRNKPFGYPVRSPQFRLPQQKPGSFVPGTDGSNPFPSSGESPANLTCIHQHLPDLARHRSAFIRN